MTLTFTGAGGQTIRRFDLHLQKKSGATKAPFSITTKPAERRLRRERKHTAIASGMNRFQWHLRYPDAVPVTGFYPPESFGDLNASIRGPRVLPGTYTVTLAYGGHKTGKSFKVSLDPRLKVSRSDLEASLALQKKIQQTLNVLDTKLNHAIALRDKLRAKNPPSRSRAADALKTLGDAIASLVQLNIQSPEGDLSVVVKLHSHLAFLQSDVGMAYAAPTAAQRAVYKHLRQQARAGEQKLATAVAAAEKFI